MVRVRTVAPGAPTWEKRVDVFLRTRPELKLVGIDRES
jgi:hypothetical protein